MLNKQEGELEHATTVPHITVKSLNHAHTGLRDAVSNACDEGNDGAAPARAARASRCPGCSEPKQRYAGWRAQQPGRATPVTSCDQQTSTFHRVPTLPSVCVALFSAAVGATPGLTATLFFPALQSCCASCRWPGRCCATSCVLAAAGLLVHTARLFPSPPAGNSLGVRRLCIDISPARRCGRCDDILVHVQNNIIVL